MALDVQVVCLGCSKRIKPGKACAIHHIKHLSFLEDSSSDESDQTGIITSNVKSNKEDQHLMNTSDANAHMTITQQSTIPVSPRWCFDCHTSSHWSSSSCNGSSRTPRRIPQTGWQYSDTINGNRGEEPADMAQLMDQVQYLSNTMEHFYDDMHARDRLYALVANDPELLYLLGVPETMDPSGRNSYEIVCATANNITLKTVESLCFIIKDHFEKVIKPKVFPGVNRDNWSKARIQKELQNCYVQILDDHHNRVTHSDFIRDFKDRVVEVVGRYNEQMDILEEDWRNCNKVLDSTMDTYNKRQLIRLRNLPVRELRVRITVHKRNEILWLPSFDSPSPALGELEDYVEMFMEHNRGTTGLRNHPSESDSNTND